MACQSSTRFCSTRFSDKTTHPKIRPEAIHSTFCDAVSMTQCFSMRPGSISSWTAFWQHLKSPGLLTSEFPLACSHRPQEGYWKVCFSGADQWRQVCGPDVRIEASGNVIAPIRWPAWLPQAAAIGPDPTCETTNLWNRKREHLALGNRAVEFQMSYGWSQSQANTVPLSFLCWCRWLVPSQVLF